MIIDRPGSHFIFIFHPDCISKNYNYIRYQGEELTIRDYLEHWGKYVFLRPPEEIPALVEQLDYFVETGQIPCVKYDRQPLTKLDLQECVVCVYCDDRQKEEVWEILKSLGVEIKAWIYEKETMEYWLPGGRLLEKWIASHNLSLDEAERLRADTRRKFRQMFANENAIFRGVEQ